MTLEEREQYLVRYDDLAPSLKILLNNKISEQDWSDLMTKVNAMAAKLKNGLGESTRDVWITIDRIQPTETTALKNLHVDTSLVLPKATNSSNAFQNLVMSLG